MGAFLVRRSLGRERLSKRLQVGDELFVYTTRGCFGNPTRDRGRVMGEALVATSVEAHHRPVRVAGREFWTSCNLTLTSLAPFRKGVEIAPIVHKLEAFPNPKSWYMTMRRPLVPITRADAETLRHALGGITSPASARTPDYLDAIQAMTGARAANA
jgi:hypothetical protein